MKTMTAFWRYDWTLNWPRHSALVAVAVVIPWIMEVGNAAMREGQLWAPFLMVVSGTLLIVALPLLFLGNLTEVGRVASPLEFRHIVHTLPVDRGEWALAKLASAFVAVGLVPMALFVAMVCAAKLVYGTPFGLKMDFVVFLFTLAAGSVWTLLMVAMLPSRWAKLSAPAFVLGEGLARGVTSFESLRTGVVRSLMAAVFDMGLLTVLAVALAVVFVLYHKRRQRGWAMVAACLALGGIDGARALACWWLRTH